MERIAVILGKMNNSGVESVVMDYYKNLDHNSYQYDFYVDQNSKGIPQLEITKLGGRVFLLPSISKVFLYQKTLKKYLKAGGYNVMHVHMNTLSFFALRVGKQLDIPVRILHNHTTSHKKEFIRHIIKVLLRPLCVKYATHFVACSAHALEWMYKNKANAKDVKIFNNAIDVNRFAFDVNKRNNLREQLGVSDNVVVGCIGRFVKQKNQTFLLDVFSECANKNDNLRLILVGEGSLECQLKEKINRYGLSQKVIILPPSIDVEKYYSCFDLFVIPSIYEGLGRVVIEAQASGLKVICSKFFPQEVDMGAGLVEFLSLKDKNGWVKAVLDTADTIDLDKAKIDRESKKVDLKQKGYDIVYASRELNEYYQNFCTDYEVAITKDEKNENLPLISVLIPVYNISAYVKQMLDSVINQSYKNIEIVVVDDGSTDDSGKICDEYLIDKRVSVYHVNNSGLASARNFLLHKASGEYITYIDGDDVVSPYYVENLYNAIINSQSDMSCCDFEKFIDGEVFPYASNDCKVEKFDCQSYLRKVLLQELECNAWGKLYKKEKMSLVKYPDGALYEDVAALPSVLEGVSTVSYTNSKDYYYRQNQKSILHKPFSLRDLDCVRFMDNLKDYVENNYPSLKYEMDTRFFSAVCNLFLRVDKKAFKNEYKYLWQKIKGMRKAVLRVKGARKKNKIAAILTYFGKFTFKTAYKLI